MHHIKFGVLYIFSCSENPFAPYLADTMEHESHYPIALVTGGTFEHAFHLPANHEHSIPIGKFDAVEYPRIVEVKARPITLDLHVREALLERGHTDKLHVPNTPLAFVLLSIISYDLVGPSPLRANLAMLLAALEALMSSRVRSPGSGGIDTPEHAVSQRHRDSALLDLLA